MATATTTLTIVRCPYCALGNGFRPMVHNSGGRYICTRCAHLASPCERDFLCTCPECLNHRDNAVRRHQERT
jgi:DNA-directed RNA polymerase subunit RPC12/RpoP